MEHGKVATAEGKVFQQIPVHQQESSLEDNKERSRSNIIPEMSMQSRTLQNKGKHITTPEK